MEGAVKAGFGIFTKGRIQPSIALGLPRKAVRVLAEKAVRTRVNRENALKNRKDRKHTRKKQKQKRKFNALVNTMTNHQRTLWVRAGYPGLVEKNVEPMKKFTNLGFAELLARRSTQ